MPSVSLAQLLGAGAQPACSTEVPSFLASSCCLDQLSAAQVHPVVARWAALRWSTQHRWQVYPDVIISSIAVLVEAVTLVWRSPTGGNYGRWPCQVSVVLDRLLQMGQRELPLCRTEYVGEGTGCCRHRSSLCQAADTGAACVSDR